MDMSIGKTPYNSLNLLALRERRMGSPLVLSSVLVCLAFLLLHGVMADQVDETMNRFISLPLNSSNFHIQKPYDLNEGSRYSFIDGVHKFWVLSSDKPLSKGSPTLPRTEVLLRGYDYSSGVWQFEGHAYVPSGTSGVSIMQVFSVNRKGPALMLRVYNGALMYYRRQVLADDIYGRWFQVNVIHDVRAGQIKIFINRDLKLTTKDQGWDSHYFKFGVYTQNYGSYFMESRWKGIKVLKLSS